jgi:hypothetical protein
MKKKEGKELYLGRNIFARAMFAAALCAMIAGGADSLRGADQQEGTAGAKASAPAGYHLVNTYKIGGDGGWDYFTVDSKARRVYITRGTHVMVMDEDSGKIVGDIPGMQRTHGVALVPKLNRGFVSDGGASMVVIFDMKTLKTIDTVKVSGQNPDCIIYDPASNRVFAFNGRTGSASALDPATGKETATIDLGGKPEFAVADGKGHVYNNLEDKSEQVEIDTKTMKVTKRWALAPCESPSGLAMDTKHRRLFAGCDNQKMAIVDPDAGKVITTVAIGDGVDANGFDEGTRLAFSSNGQSATLTVVKEDSLDKYSVAGDVATERGARTMAVDEKTHHVFVVTASFGPQPEKATTDNPRRRPPMLPDSFRVLEFAQ